MEDRLNEKLHVIITVNVFKVIKSKMLNDGVKDNFGMFKKGMIRMSKLSKKKYLKTNMILGFKMPSIAMKPVPPSVESND